jgi:MraZ protein
LFTEAEWRKISGKLSEASLLTADNRSFNRYMFGGATDTPVDTAGRILVPEFLKDRAKLAEKVVLVGVQSRVEIWNETAWKKMKQVFEKEADRLAEKLGEVGVL